MTWSKGILPNSLTAKMMNYLKSPSLSLTILISLLNLPAAIAVPSQDPNAEAWNSSQEIDDDDTFEFFRKVITISVTVVIIVVAVCLLLCFCCPICIIAKMRQRRGVIIRTGPGATTTTTNGRNVTVTVNRSVAPVTSNVNTTPVVAISNNYNDRSKPYPVQESVTVVPLLHPQQQAAPQVYPPVSQPLNYPPAPQFPQNFELPPPYPGLPRDSETSNLPYNPYYTDESNAPTAPPPK